MEGVGSGKPCIYQSFSVYRYTDVGKHLTVYKVRERSVLQCNSIMRKWFEDLPLLIMIHMCGNLRRMGLKTLLRGSRIPEKLNTRPNRTLLEGEKTGRKCSGYVWQDENSVRQ